MDLDSEVVRTIKVTDTPLPLEFPVVAVYKIDGRDAKGQQVMAYFGHGGLLGVKEYLSNYDLGDGNTIEVHRRTLVSLPVCPQQVTLTSCDNVRWFARAGGSVDCLGMDGCHRPIEKEITAAWQRIRSEHGLGVIWDDAAASDELIPLDEVMRA